MPEFDEMKERELLDLLQKQKGYYCNILELTRQENEKYRAKRSFEEIMPLIKQKGIIIACVDELSSRLNPLKEYWNIKDDYSNFFSEKVREQLNELDLLMKELLKLDQENQELFQDLVIAMKETVKR